MNWFFFCRDSPKNFLLKKQRWQVAFSWQEGRKERKKEEERKRKKETNKQTNIQTNKQTNKQSKRERDRYTEKESQRERDTDKKVIEGVGTYQKQEEENKSETT